MRFVCIVLLFGSLDVLESLDLRTVVIVIALGPWPLLYGLLANGLLVTAKIRTASAMNARFPLPSANRTEPPQPLP
jgi:hypothetical protein